MNRRRSKARRVARDFFGISFVLLTMKTSEVLATSWPKPCRDYQCLLLPSGREFYVDRAPNFIDESQKIIDDDERTIDSRPVWILGKPEKDDRKIQGIIDVPRRTKAFEGSFRRANNSFDRMQDKITRAGSSLYSFRQGLNDEAQQKLTLSRGARQFNGNPAKQLQAGFLDQPRNNIRGSDRNSSNKDKRCRRRRVRLKYSYNSCGTGGDVVKMFNLAKRRVILLEALAKKTIDPQILDSIDTHEFVAEFITKLLILNEQLKELLRTGQLPDWPREVEPTESTESKPSNDKLRNKYN